MKSYLAIPRPKLQKHILEWLEEDIPNFDYAGAIVANDPSRARLLCKSKGIIAGLEFANEIFRHLDCVISWKIQEGQSIEEPVKEIGVVEGPTNGIMRGERIALNLLARLSGIATHAALIKKKVTRAGFKGVIAGSRKTTPGFRLFEKYALMEGGCDPHRFDLSSCIMLKDNHIDAVGSIEEAVRRVKKLAGFTLKIEVECRDLHEALNAIKAGVDIVMLDNFKPTMAKESAKQLKRLCPDIIIEVSGGINSDNVLDYVSDEIDVISMGCLTQGYPIVDLSLKLITDKSQ